MKSIANDDQEDAHPCDGCPLDGTVPPLDSKVPNKAKYLFVTDLPRPSDAEMGRLMSVKAANLIAAEMENLGFERGDFAFHPAICCPHDPDLHTAKEKREIAKHCRGHFLDVVQDMRPEVIIPLGAEPAKQVLNKAVKITKIRGVPAHSPEHNAMILPMLSPGMVIMYPQHEASFRSDCSTLARLVDHEMDIDAASREVVGEYEYIDDLQFLIDADPEVVCFDVETTSLRWFKTGCDVRTYREAEHKQNPEFDPRAQILTMQFCIEPGKAYMLPWDHPDAPMSSRQKAKLKRQLRLLLCKVGRTVIGQNLKYDNVMLATQTGVRFRISGDTMMLATLLDENSNKNLDDLTKRYVPELAGYADRFNLVVDKGRMWEVPLEDDFLEYGCGDVDASLRLYQRVYAEVAKDKKLLNHYRFVTLPGLNAFASIEMRGLYVNEDAVDVFEAHMEESVEAQRVELLRQIPRTIKRKHIRLAEEKNRGRPVDAKEALKFSKKDFVLDVLFTHKDGLRLKPKVFTKGTAKMDEERKVPSLSSKQHLPYFFEEEPFTQELAQYIKDERLLGTNIKGFKKKYIIDGMVRPTYSLAKAVTGRSSSEDPNGQNFPKRGNNAKAYRRIFVPPPGHFLLEADLSQAELRISADIAREPTMLDIYRRNGDIHTRTALFVMGITQAQFDELPKDEQKLARFKAKAVNFGFIYGMGWRKFMGYAKTDYGVTFTEREAQRIRELFFETYSRLPAWHDAMRRFAHEHGYVRDYSGRIRHLPTIHSDDDFIRSEAERQAINSPVQGFGSHLGVMAIGRLNEQIDARYLAPVAFVHDAIYCYVPKEYLQWGAKTLKWYMESNKLEEWFGVKLRVPIVADVAFGENMGDMHEMKGLDLRQNYNFGQFWDAEENSGILVPEQRTPPKNGKTSGSIYTYAEDVEFA